MSSKEKLVSPSSSSAVLANKDSSEIAEEKVESERKRFIFPNGDIYEGEFKQTDYSPLERSGLGVYKCSDGTVYDGQWVEDKMHGLGVMSFPGGSEYRGNFIKNKFNGYGRYSWPNGCYYEGVFVENKLKGPGKFFDENGQCWQGTFSYKQAHGLQFKF